MTQPAPGTPGSSPANAPATAAGLAAALVALLTALAGWGLDSVSWPAEVEAALLLLGITAAGLLGQAVGRYAQRYTWPDWKVQALSAEVADHGDGPLG